MITINTGDPIKAALLRMMIDAARDLNGASDRGPGGAYPDEPVNVEYARGQAELICDTIGLSMDEHKEALIDAITLGHPVTIIRHN